MEANWTLWYNQNPMTQQKQPLKLKLCIFTSLLMHQTCLPYKDILSIYSSPWNILDSQDMLIGLFWK